MESVVLSLLEERGWTLGLAESVTGGLVGGRITSIAGASRVFKGGVISYASDVKFDVLGVEAGPVVSERAAMQMAFIPIVTESLIVIEFLWYSADAVHSP